MTEPVQTQRGSKQMKRGKVMKRQHLMTITESQYGAGCGVITFADKVLAIENDDVVTVTDKGGRLCMEFTGPGSQVAPFASVYGTLSMDGWSVKAEVGPGYALTQDTLDAYEYVALRRIARNQSSRIAAIAYEASVVSSTGQRVSVAI